MHTSNSEMDCHIFCEKQILVAAHIIDLISCDPRMYGKHDEKHATSVEIAI
jgi:hypothetical protein